MFYITINPRNGESKYFHQDELETVFCTHDRLEAMGELVEVSKKHIWEAVDLLKVVDYEDDIKGYQDIHYFLARETKRTIGFIFDEDDGHIISSFNGDWIKAAAKQVGGEVTFLKSVKYEHFHANGQYK